MTCTTHHDACECRMEIIREHLVPELADYVSACPYCTDGELLEGYRHYRSYRAADGSCERCLYGRAALQLAREVGWTA